MSELKLITPRRNFLVRALGFTVAGVTLPIGIVAADDPRARIAHHQGELEKAWRDYYGAAAVRTYADVRTPGATYTSFRNPSRNALFGVVLETYGLLVFLENHPVLASRKCEIRPETRHF